MTGLAFSFDGRSLVSAATDGGARIWDVQTHRQRGLPIPVGISSFVALHTGGGSAEDVSDSPIALSPDGHTLAVAGTRNTVQLWDIRTHKRDGSSLAGHSQPPGNMAFSPDGQMVAASSEDHTIRVWDTTTHEQLGQPLVGSIIARSAVAFSPDGRTLAAGATDGKIRLWDLAARKPLGRPLNSGSAAVTSAAFTPDGQTLVAANDDHRIRIWDVASRVQLGPPLSGHAGAVTSVAISSAWTLASASADHTARLWEGILWGDFRLLQRDICALVGTGLSRAEFAARGTRRPTSMSVARRAQYAAHVPYHRTCP